MSDLTPEDMADDRGVRRAMADLARAGCGIMRMTRTGPDMCFKEVVITVTTPRGLPVGLCEEHARKYHDEGSLPSGPRGGDQPPV